MFEEDTYWSGQGETSVVKTESPESSKNAPIPVNQSTVTDSENIDPSTIRSHINVHSLIKCYQQRGHLVADLDPLGITTISVKEDHGIKRRADESVTKNYFDFSAGEMEKEFFLPPSTFIGGSKKTMKLRFVSRNYLIGKLEFNVRNGFCEEKLWKTWRMFTATRSALNTCTIKTTKRFIGFGNNSKRREVVSLPTTRRS